MDYIRTLSDAELQAEIERIEAEQANDLEEAWCGNAVRSYYEEYNEKLMPFISEQDSRKRIKPWYSTPKNNFVVLETPSEPSKRSPVRHRIYMLNFFLLAPYRPNCL